MARDSNDGFLTRSGLLWPGLNSQDPANIKRGAVMFAKGGKKKVLKYPVCTEAAAPGDNAGVKDEPVLSSFFTCEVNISVRHTPMYAPASIHASVPADRATGACHLYSTEWKKVRFVG